MYLGTIKPNFCHTDFSRFSGRKRCFLFVFFVFTQRLPDYNPVTGWKRPVFHSLHQCKLLSCKPKTGQRGIVCNYVFPAVSLIWFSPFISVSSHHAVSLFCAAKVNVDVTGSSFSEKISTRWVVFEPTVFWKTCSSVLQHLLMQRKKGETYRVATGDAEKKSSNQGNSK